MVITATLGVALLFTLLLPLYPTGLDGSILAFFVLVSVAALLAMTSRPARRELLVLSVWSVAVALGAVVGLLQDGDPQQIVEDILPYVLFTLGLVAGRAAECPRHVLLIVLALCLYASFVSLVKVAPHYTPGFRSTWVYGPIVTGVSLLGMFVLLFLGRLDREAGCRRSLARSPVAPAFYAVMLLATIASGSRGMMLGCVVGVAALAYVQRPSRAVLATLVVTVLYVAYSSSFADIGVRYLRADQVGTIDARFDEVRTSLALFTERPLLGSGLGATLIADGAHHAYVHNIIAYHLWKFGMLGSFLLTVPLLVVGAQVRRYPRPLAAAAISGAAAVFAYLVTCAGYKVYYVVWIQGVTAGAVLSALWASSVVKKGAPS